MKNNLNGIETTNLKTNDCKEIIAGQKQPSDKIFTNAALWNIQRRRKSFRLRRTTF